MKLTETIEGTTVRIVSMAAVSDIVRRRLCDLCLTEGCYVSLQNKLPFGGPCTLRSNGQSVAIRRKDAAGIEVESL